MCSTPKSSTTFRRNTRLKTMNRSEYAEYSRIVRKASACYEAEQQRKAEQLQTDIQEMEGCNKQLHSPEESFEYHSYANDDAAVHHEQVQKQPANKTNYTKPAIFSVFKAILMKPIF